MCQQPAFAFASAAACRDRRIGDCPQVAVNVPGTVALRNSERPDTIVTMTAAEWVMLTMAIKAGEFDLSA